MMRWDELPCGFWFRKWYICHMKKRTLGGLSSWGPPSVINTDYDSPLLLKSFLPYQLGTVLCKQPTKIISYTRLKPLTKNRPVNMEGIAFEIFANLCLFSHLNRINVQIHTIFLTQSTHWNCTYSSF